MCYMGEQKRLLFGFVKLSKQSMQEVVMEQDLGDSLIDMLECLCLARNNMM